MPHRMLYRYEMPSCGKHVLDACPQVFLDGQAALEEEERKEERAGKEFRRFNRRCHCSPYAIKVLPHIHASHCPQKLHSVQS